MGATIVGALSEIYMMRPKIPNKDQAGVSMVIFGQSAQRHSSHSHHS